MNITTCILHVLPIITQTHVRLKWIKTQETRQNKYEKWKEGNQRKERKETKYMTEKGGKTKHEEEK